jgi:signal transduction histidine kinase
LFIPGVFGLIHFQLVVEFAKSIEAGNNSNMAERPSSSIQWNQAVQEKVIAYALAVSLPCLALFINLVVPSLFAHAHYFLLIAAVVLVSLYGGAGPGVLSLFVSIIGPAYLFIEPTHSLFVSNDSDRIILGTFFLTALLTCAVATRLRSSLRTTVQAKLAAEQAIAARTELLAILSHDLKNPITGIQLRKDLALRILSQPSLDMQNLRTQLESIGSSAQHVTYLIQDILDMESIEAGELRVDKHPVSLGEILSGVLNVYKPIAENKGIQLETDLHDSQIQIDCDKLRISQALSNLVGNAVKFTIAGTVKISSRALNGSAIQVSVSDTGPGIRKDQIPRLFDRHWQAETSKTGHGLGLFIVKGIIEAHHGKVWVESVPGTGTTFYFTLPLPDAA